MQKRVCLTSSCLLFLLSACGGSSSPAPGGDGVPDANVDVARDPFAPQPDTSEGLTNVSADLRALLENGALATACADYAAAPADRRKRLLCGKAMFFYEGFGTAGVPVPLADWLIANFPDDVGPGFGKLGMVPDPFSTKSYPLGLAPGAPIGSVGTLAFTCASCHFGKLPDGRYAVGAANHAYDYGRMNLMLTVVPAMAMPGANEAAHDPGALAAVKPLRDRMAANPGIQTSLITAMLPLISGGGASLPEFTAENESYYARWRSGTMDFFIQPLPFDDRVHTISKISSLWCLPTRSELTAAGIPSAMLSWTGGTTSLEHFLTGFVDLGGGKVADWPDARLAPLHDYIESLRAPAPAAAPADVSRGRAVFVVECQSCHGGPRGMGDRFYTYEEIGTDDAMKWWADGPDHDGQPCCGLRFLPGDTLTHALKSPRLVGMWAASRFLHNGSLDSLEQLLCLAPRPDVTVPAFGSRGHDFGCALPDDERTALVQYLRAH
ncbi:MAG: hypothetical protein JNL83_24615 [Myxococcales bacterium]|nr:hypothetical protein [Myxococcales bacterium]